MKLRLSLTGMVVLALLLAVGGPAAAQQTFTQADLEGDWSLYVYGAYDAYTESFYGDLNLNSAGGLMTGFGYWRSVDSFMIQGQLVVDASGGVSGILQCEHSKWNIIFARMSQRKNEISGMAEGIRSYVMLRMVKYNSEPASLPGDDESVDDGTGDGTTDEEGSTDDGAGAEDSDPEEDEPDDNDSGSGGILGGSEDGPSTGNPGGSRN